MRSVSCLSPQLLLARFIDLRRPNFEQGGGANKLVDGVFVQHFGAVRQELCLGLFERLVSLWGTR